VLRTRVLVSPAAVQLLGAEAGATLGAVPDKDGEEDDGEDLEEKAQPGELEPRGIGHVAGWRGQENPPKLGRQEEKRAGASNSARQGGCQVLPSPRCFPRAEEPVGSGTELPTRKPRASRPGTPRHLVLPRQTAWATVLGKHTGLAVSASVSAGCQGVRMGFGVGGAVNGGSPRGFSRSGGSA